MPSRVVSGLSCSDQTRGEFNMVSPMDTSRAFVKDVKRLVVKVC